MSAGHEYEGVTPGSVIVFSPAGGKRGVGGMCICLARGSVGGEGM